MLDRKSFEEIYGKYRQHPKVVISGFDGLPILEPDKFYLVLHRNGKDSYRESYKLWRCHSTNGQTGEYRASYFMTTQDLDKRGCVAICGQYVWFDKGNNCVIELPDEQQKALQILWDSIGSQAGCKYSWEICSEFPEVWRL